jgi:hypothetical protein
MKYKLDNIPITTTLDHVLEELRIGEPDDIALVTSLFETAKEIARPKVLYKESFVEEISGNDVLVDDVLFTSGVLAANLKDVHRVFAYVCTCGTEVDDWSNNEKDYVVGLWLDMIKEMFLRDAITYFQEYMKNNYKFKKMSSINPGSGDVENWNITQQSLLFGLIGEVQKEIGVVLTDTSLMHPIKSTSGLIYPSETEFKNCVLCHRENCSGRSAEFDSELYAKTFNAPPN